MHVAAGNVTDVHKLPIADRPIMRGVGPEVSAQRACERSSERGWGAAAPRPKEALDPKKPKTQRGPRPKEAQRATRSATPTRTCTAISTRGCLSAVIGDIEPAAYECLLTGVLRVCVHEQVRVHGWELGGPECQGPHAVRTRCRGTELRRVARIALAVDEHVDTVDAARTEARIGGGASDGVVAPGAHIGLGRRSGNG